MLFLRKRMLFAVPLLFLLLVAAPALAQTANQIPNPLGKIESFPALLAKIAEVIGGLIAAIGTVMVVVSGILFLISAGNEQRVSLAKATMFWAVMGMLVGLSTTAITGFVEMAAAGNTVADVLSNIIIQVSGLMAGLGTVMLIIGGIAYLFSLGDPSKISTAKKIIFYAIAGIIIGVASGAIVEFVKGIAGP